MTLNYSVVITFIAALFAIYVIMWIFVGPVKFFLKSAVSGIIGCGALYLCNLLCTPVGIAIGINLYTAAVCAFLGVPGFLFLLAARLIF